MSAQAQPRPRNTIPLTPARPSAGNGQQQLTPQFDPSSLQWVTETLQQVLGDLTAHANRGCAIEIDNGTQYPIVPLGYYTDSGWCEDALVTIPVGDKGACGFTKTKGTACGAVGVQVIQVTSSSSPSSPFAMAILFSVPFSSANSYLIVAPVNGAAAPKDIYNQYEGQMQPPGQTTNFNYGGYTILATMNEGDEATLDVEIYPTTTPTQS